MKRLIIYSLGFVLTGCTLNAPVIGVIDGDERFSGTASRTYPFRSGELDVVSNHGVRCTGKFSYFKGNHSGSGKFTCSDGREGRYNFTVMGSEGHGIGKTFNGQDIEFYFNRPGK
ncbi:MAG TPA: hypothetical protein DIV86_07040 [Alphaproteobacteria bacterium]|nr:hypothetical protein [Alphaproteobacteria bacterium]